MRPIGLILFLFLCFAASAQKQKPYVVLVSFDGFRHDYVERFNTPNFHKLIKRGSHAKGLVPSFPSKTFPNHYTLITGLYPGHHGLVDNHFYDPEQHKRYSMKDRKMLTDSTFYGGVPLWQLAQQHGMKSASFFWVGSETVVKGRYPDYYFQYNESVPDEDRIAQTVAWLNLPEKERPHFISLYFSFTDVQGHSTGTNSNETQKAVEHADSVLGVLVKKINHLKIPVNLVVVSDHGMAELKLEESTFITLGKLFNISDTAVVYVNGGTQAHLYTNKSDSLYRVLKEKEFHFKVYRRKDFPQQWHYDNPRSGDVLIVADPGYYIQEASNGWRKQGSKAVFGAHGYDPYVTTDMQGIFYAAGPNIKQGITLDPFGNIHVYPFIARILGLKTPTIDGEDEVLLNIIR